MKNKKLLIAILLMFTFFIFTAQTSFAEDKGVLFTGVITATSLNIREKPSTKSPVIGKYERGTELDVFEVRHTPEGDWYFIYIIEEIEGWAMAKYIKPKYASALKSPSSLSNIAGSYYSRDVNSTLNISWVNKKNLEVKVELLAVARNGNTGEWEGQGEIHNGVLKIYDIDFDAEITLIFEKNGTVKVETKDFEGIVGVGVTFDGTYKRK